MINLLPPDVKESYRYARRNVTLRKWLVLFVVALVGLIGIGTYGLLTLQSSTNTYQHQIADQKKLFEKEDFEGTQADVRDISSSFKLVVKVLGQEVLFSKLIKQIAAAIPSDAKLTGLNINQTKGGLDITASATNYSAATQVQVNLSDPNNKIFSKADIVSITCGGSNASDPHYPCTVNIRALFGSNNPYLFINSQGNNPGGAQ
jgi:Tfp pilus assembly protein PilN